MSPSEVLQRSLSACSWLRRGQRAGGAIVVGLAVLASVATSQPPPDWQDARWGSLFIVSAVDDRRVVTVRPLRTDVQLDCGYVAEDPTNRLPPALFGELQSWWLEARDAVPINASRAGCDAVIIGGAGAQPALVFWRDGELPPNEQVDLETLRLTSERSIFLEDTEAGARFGEHPLRYAAPPVTPSSAGESCPVPGRGAVAWSVQMPRESAVLAGVQRSPDGCYALDLEGEADALRVFLCLAGEELPFSVGDALTLEELPLAGGVSLVVTSDAVVLEAVRAGALAADVSIDAPTPRAECAPRVDACGSVLLPANVVIRDDDETRPLEVGAWTTLASGTRLFLATAFTAPVRVPECTPTPTYFESFSLTERE